MITRLTFASVVLLLISAPALAGDDVPPWLQQAAASTVPTYARDVPAVVLNDESTVTVKEDGHVTITSTYAVKVLTREGRDYAVAELGYQAPVTKIREMRAWLIHPSGDVKRYNKDKALDAAGDIEDVYDEWRVRVISAKDDAENGAIFGYQFTEDYQKDFNQDRWFFQERLPVVMSRIRLVLPAGWSALSITFNHEEVKPVVEGSSYSWELRNLPPIEKEQNGPGLASLAPRLAVSYAPPSGETGGASRSFQNWNDVSRWYTTLSDPQAAPDDALAGKARELTANAKTELERIRLIGQFVQNLQYISIQIGVGRYRPHSAAQVFAKRYGDCKDKANLMRAMLKAVKLESYPVLIYAGDPSYVRAEWPSAGQFNHCIIAIKVSDATEARSVIDHPKLGRLLIFDATDDDTSVGDLPYHEQGSFALIAAGEAGSLERMPVIPPESSMLERQANVTLSADGSIQARVHEQASGQSAARLRGEFRHLSPPEYTKYMEGWITQGATAAKITKIEPSDGGIDGRFSLDLDVAIPFYAQLMQGRLLVIKPVIISRGESIPPIESIRKQAIVLRSKAFTETVRIKLPAGFTVDETPDPANLKTDFGAYTTSYEVKGDELTFTRKLVQRAVTIPPDQSASVLGFFARIQAAETAPVVLAKN